MAMKRRKAMAAAVAVSQFGGGTEPQVFAEVRELILAARQTVARGVNAALVMLYWKVGDRIRREVLKEKRAEYGAEILPTLSAKLVGEFGRGFNEKNLRRMVQFAEVFPESEIVATLSRQLGWSHFVELLPLNKRLQREFYAEMCENRASVSSCLVSSKWNKCKGRRRSRVLW